MATVLLATLLALLLGHTVPELSRLRDYSWFQYWLRSWSERLGESQFWHGPAAIILSIGLPVVLLALLQWSLLGVWWGLPSFALAAAVVFYCWGPRDLDIEIEAIGALTERDERIAALQRLPEDPPAPPLRLEGGPVVDQVFMAALSRWFGVLFWFFVLGASGALLYRLVCLADGSRAYREALSLEQAGAAKSLHRLMNWPAAQLMTLALALAADFDAVVTAWRDFHGQRVPGWYSAEPGYMTAAARASVDLDSASEEEAAVDESALLAMQQAMALIWRVLVVWLAALSVFVLAGKIG
jgi:AmpE protein